MHSTKRDTGLNCHPVSGKFPTFEKPQPIGYFSVNAEREYEPNASQLHYYKPPPPKNFPLDLMDGIQLVIRKPESAYSEDIDHMLKFIFDNQKQLFTLPEPSAQRKIFCAEFVCWRGVLRRLMCVPYERREPLTICVTRYMGTFYLNKPDTKEDRDKRAKETQHQRNMCSWGFKFEQYCLSKSPFSVAKTQLPVNECTEFSCVFKTRLGGLEILYGAEMDGIVSDQPVLANENTKLSDIKFVELKVCQGYMNRRQVENFNRFKTRAWWCQSFLVGVNDLYVGRRTDSGLVQNIEHMEVRSLPKLGAKYWDPSACSLFAIEFLKYLKSIMSHVNCPYSTYIFYFDPVKCRISYECYDGKTLHSFLPDWYISLLKNQCKSRNVNTR